MTNEDFYREQQRRLKRLMLDLANPRQTYEQPRLYSEGVVQQSNRVIESQMRHELACIMWDIEAGRQP